MVADGSRPEVVAVDNAPLPLRGEIDARPVERPLAVTGVVGHLHVET